MTKETFHLFLKSYENAIDRLDEATELEFSTIVRDAAIQRFEYCFELSWKVIKRFLETYEGVTGLNSPNSALKAGFQNRLILNEIIWRDMPEKRNLTSHLYSEEIADEVYPALKDYVIEYRSLHSTVFSQL